MSDTSPAKPERRGQRNRWRKVELARERIQKNANKVAQALIDKAIAGDVKAARFLLEHTAATDADGNEVRPLASGIDRQQPTQNAADAGPRILIGVSLGADFARLNTHQPDRHALPAVVVSQPVTDGQ